MPDENVAINENRAKRLRAVIQDCVRRRAAGEVILDEALIGANRELMPELASELQKLRVIATAREQAQQPTVELRETLSHFDAETGSGRGAGDQVATITPGSTIGRFQLLDVLGHGGMGKVYRALDPRLEREVAIKVPRRDLFESEAERERFIREARSAAKVQHPNVCPIYEIDETEGKTFLVMALVDGECLSRRIRAEACSSSAVAARLVLKVARAVQAAHAKGIIHRDLKPSNIMINDLGEPMVMDFGLARRLESQDLRVTHTGDLLGTPAYMSPEQAAGGAASVGPTSDIYSLGVILYELLCGRPPFKGSTAEILAQILRDQPPPPFRFEPRVDRELETICLRAMSKRPEDRYASMSDLAAALDDWLIIHDERKSVSSREAAGTTGSRTHRITAPALTAIGVLFLATLAGLAYYYGREEEVVVTDGGSAVTVNDANDDVVDVRRTPQLPPMGPTTLVTGPAKLAGLQSWTFDTRFPRGRVQVCCASPDGTLVATGGNDTTIRIWDPVTGEIVRMLISKDNMPISALAWSPNGKLLAAGHLSGEFELWDAIGGRSLHSFRAVGDEHDVTAIAWSPDSAKIAIAGVSTLRVWDAQTAEALETLTGHNGSICVAWHPTEDRLASCGADDRTVRFWNLAARDRDAAIAIEGDNSPKCIAWSPNGKAVVVGETGRTIEFFDPDTGKRTNRATAHHDVVLAMAWSHDGARLATTSGDGIRLWDEQGNPLDHFAESIFHRSLAWCNQDRSLITVDEQGLTTGIWQVGGARTRTLSASQYRVTKVAFAPVGDRLAIGTEGAGLQVWQVRPTMRREFDGRDFGHVLALAWTPDGDTLAAGGSGGEIRLWNAATKRTQRELHHTGQVLGLAWAPDGQRLASAGADGTARIWSADSNVPLHVLMGHESSAHSVAWSPDGNVVATGDNKTIRFWDPDTGAAIHTQDSPHGTVYSLAYSPTGSALATAGEGGKAYIWDRDATNEIGASSAGYYVVTAIAWSPDGSRFACTGDHPDRQIKVFDVNSNTLVYAFRGISDTANSLSWHPSGTLFASAGDMQPVRVWNSNTGEIADTIYLTGAGDGVGVMPDGRYVASSEAQKELLYVALTEDGRQITYSPAEFSSRYGWDNEKGVVPRQADDEANARAGIEKIFQFGGRCMANVNGVSLDIRSAAELPQDLSTIELVWLESDTVRKVVDSDLANLSGLTGLKELYLSHSDVTGEGLHHLASCRELRAVHLGRSKLNDRGLAKIAKLKSIRALNCDNTPISDAGLIHLEKLSLTILGSGNTRVSDAGMRSVSRIRTLEDLYLEHTSIGDLGVLELRALNRLVTLRLNNTLVSDAGLDSLPRRLRVLDVAHTPISGRGLQSIAQLSQLEELDLTDNAVAEGLHYLNGCPSLRRLALAYSDVTDAKIAKIADLRRLTDLTADHTAITGRGLGQFHDIAHLNLQHAAVDETGISEITALSNLRVLVLGENALVDADLATIGRAQGLQELYLANNNLTDAVVPELIKLKRLKHLELMGNSKITTGRSTRCTES